MNLSDFCAMAVGDSVNAGPMCPACKEPITASQARVRIGGYSFHAACSHPVPASILPPPCERCEGRGEIEEACGRDQFGVYETDVWPCPDCHGTGDA